MEAAEKAAVDKGVAIQEAAEEPTAEAARTPKESAIEGIIEESTVETETTTEKAIEELVGKRVVEGPVGDEVAKGSVEPEQLAAETEQTPEKTTGESTVGVEETARVPASKTPDKSIIGEVLSSEATLDKAIEKAERDVD